MHILYLAASTKEACMARFYFLLAFQFALCALPNTVQGQIMKFVKNSVNVKYKVYITAKPEEATIWVYKVKRPDEALSYGLWYIVDNPQLFKDATTLFEVSNKEEADLIVWYTTEKQLAGKPKR
jgi:hypothetical protein